MLFHVLVATGVALVGTGASALQSDHATPNDLTLVNIGLGILTASWVLLCIWSSISYLPTQKDTKAPAHRHGTIVSRILGAPACA